MKKIITLLILFYYLVYPQDIDLIGIPGGRVLKLKAHPTIQHKIFAGTYYGNLFYTLDDGLSNNFLDLNFGRHNINEINLIDNNIYVKLWKYILRSTNSGADWHIDSLTSNLSTQILTNPYNPSIVFIINDQKEIWKSYDKGENWFLLKNFNSNLRSIAIAKTDTSVLYTGADFTIYKSTNSGLDWFRTLDSTISISIYQLEVNPYNENSIYFYDFTNKLWKSEDGGNTYRNILNTDWTAGFVVNPQDTAILYSFNSATGISKTTNEGLTWNLVNNGVPGFANCLEIDPLNPETLYAGINSLGVFKTINGGENWLLTNLSYSSDILSILIHRSNKIEVGQYGWGIMKTTNRGEDWIHPVFVPDDYQNISCYEITYNPSDSSKGYLAAGLALGKTTDGGESWHSTFQLPGIRCVSYYPSNPEILFAGISQSPGSSFIYQSTDGGENWFELLNTSHAFDAGVNKFYFDPVNTEIIYGIGFGMILKSTDSGLTWENKENGIIRYGNYLTNITDFAIKKDETNILYCTQKATYPNKGHLYKSSDGGENWFRIDSVLHSLDPWTSLASILLDEEKLGRIYVGMTIHVQPFVSEYTNGALFLTEDDGKTWRKVYGGEVTKIRADYNKPRNIYFATKFGLMTLLDTLTVITSIDFVNDEVPDRYYLSQNYPNPFNPTTNIKYSIPESQIVQIKIYDILGREIKTILNEYKQAGTYEIEFSAGSFGDAGALPSGVYFYKLQAGNFTETKKMILLR
jgi:photosystem II stability/assembly factor-like uncharacterized protein